jgi:hypothetical protein
MREVGPFRCIIDEQVILDRWGLSTSMRTQAASTYQIQVKILSADNFDRGVLS